MCNGLAFILVPPNKTNVAANGHVWRGTPGRWTRLDHLDLAELLKDALPVPNELEHLHKTLSQPQPEPTELTQDGDGGPTMLTVNLQVAKK